MVSLVHNNKRSSQTYFIKGNICCFNFLFFNSMHVTSLLIEQLCIMRICVNGTFPQILMYFFEITVCWEIVFVDKIMDKHIFS